LNLTHTVTAVDRPIKYKLLNLYHVNALDHDRGRLLRAAAIVADPNPIIEFPTIILMHLKKIIVFK
jgi:hypothetical protein